MKFSTFLTILLLGLYSTIFVSCKKEPVVKPEEPVAAVGDHYGGGTVFYVDKTGQHGFVVTPDDLGTFMWTNESGPSTGFKYLITQEFLSTVESSPGNAGIGVGNLYTDRIVDSLGAGSYAAKVCSDLNLNGYSDWYLPTYEEMFLFFQLTQTQRSALFNGDTESFYWSSCDKSSQKALAYRIFGQQPSGTAEFPKKALNIKVRAIRKF